MNHTRIAINGFGRIGRTALKIALQHADECTVIAVNDLADGSTLAHLLQHDSAYGTYEHEVRFKDGKLWVGRQSIAFFQSKEPESLPWRELGIDVVLECTGHFLDVKTAGVHLKAGARRVLISAPSKGEDPAPTHVLGVNPADGKATVLNNASCTTNCITPLMAVLEREFGIELALMSTIHSYTQDQMLQDGPHKDLRRARAAANSIVPTTTGAAIATTESIPTLKDRFDGVSFRVPTLVVSLSDLTVLLKKEVSVAQVNAAFKKAAGEDRFTGILAVTEEELVSSDFRGNPYSAIVDLPLTQVVGGKLVKVVAWYDNEWGYSNRLVEQAILMGHQAAVA